jgi:hypothetical protein
VTPTKSPRVFLAVLLFFIGCGAVVLVFLWPNRTKPVGPPPELDTGSFAFDNSSNKLAHHVVVPTLDSRLAPDKGALWCSSFLLVWKELGGAINDKTNPLFASLNRAEVGEDDFPPDSFYTQSGPYNQTLVDKITTDMRQRFPNRLPPVLAGRPGQGNLLAYAYLEHAIRFEFAYKPLSEAKPFRSSVEPNVPVQMFGMDYDKVELRRQLKVLYSSLNAESGPAIADECIIDLCANSSTDQLLLARIEKKETLEAMLKDVDAKLKSNRQRDFYKRDELLVPNLSLKLNHRFTELETDNVGIASQSIQYRLNHTGAELKSEAQLLVKAEPPPEPGPVKYHFDKPFLLVMQKRGAKRPYFVMWVNSAEFLDK